MAVCRSTGSVMPVLLVGCAGIDSQRGYPSRVEDIWWRRVYAWRDMSVKIIETW